MKRTMNFSAIESMNRLAADIATVRLARSSKDCNITKDEYIAEIDTLVEEYLDEQGISINVSTWVDDHPRCTMDIDFTADLPDNKGKIKVKLSNIRSRKGEQKDRIIIDSVRAYVNEEDNYSNEAMAVKNLRGSHFLVEEYLTDLTFDGVGDRLIWLIINNYIILDIDLFILMMGDQYMVTQAEFYLRKWAKIKPQWFDGIFCPIETYEDRFGKEVSDRFNNKRDKDYCDGWLQLTIPI